MLQNKIKTTNTKITSGDKNKRKQDTHKKKIKI